MSTTGQEWFSIEEAAAATGESIRTMRRKLAAAPANCLRTGSADGRGRPPTLYHFMSDPRLQAQHELSVRGDSLNATPPEPAQADERVSIAPDDLTVARLRLQAVLEYVARRQEMPEAIAAEATCDDWRQRNPTLTVATEERLPGGHKRKLSRQISISGFSPRSLRRWHALYIRNSANDLAALAPTRKGSSGRSATDVPEALLEFVHGLSVSTARADVAKALQRARQHWPGDFPELSLSTWQRRIRVRDPRRALDALGKHGIQEFRKTSSPDISIAWNDLPYNGLWLIDDVQEDWYAHASAEQKLLRPFAYAIQRTATRQWVAFVASETPITAAQVRTLVGWAMADAQGGIPEAIKFEHGAVACDSTLRDLLVLLGVKVQLTSMDSGRVYDRAFPDRSGGHPQGKAPIERAMRGHHDTQWAATAQIGTNERETKPARMDALLKEAQRRRDAGEFLILPEPHQWHQQIRDAMEAQNSRPNEGLPRIVDPETGAARNMSPNEAAQARKAERIRVLDQSWLPLFAARGERVPVTRNGIRVHNRTYGRFDQELQAMADVQVYVADTQPDLAYVVELGRCLESDEPVQYGDAGRIESKRGVERKFRSQYEAAVAAVIAQDFGLMPDLVQVTRDPVPARPRELAVNPVLSARAVAIRAGQERHRSAQEALDARFAPPDPASGPQQRSRGLLARAEDLAAEVAILGGAEASVASRAQ